MKCLKTCFGAAALCLWLLGSSGCALTRFWLPGSGGEEPCGLLVVNDSREAVYAVSVDWGDRTMGVQDAGGRALMERGDALSFPLEEETGRFTITLSGENGRTLGRASGNYRGRPIWMTLREDGRVSLREEGANGMDVE